jgi:hypothetical protein
MGSLQSSVALKKVIVAVDRKHRTRANYLKLTLLFFCRFTICSEPPRNVPLFAPSVRSFFDKIRSASALLLALHHSTRHIFKCVFRTGTSWFHFQFERTKEEGLEAEEEQTT